MTSTSDWSDRLNVTAVLYRYAAGIDQKDWTLFRTCFADRCGVERGVDWISGTLIAGPEGYLLAGPVLADHPALLVADCDLAAARDKRINEHNDLLADRRPELYPRVTSG